MDSSEHRFVSFERPPVEEVAFGVQLVDPVVDIEVLAGLASVLHDRFPVRQRQPALPRMTEPEKGVIAMHFGVGVALPRTWFVSGDGHRVVQAQEDRIAFNWRRLGRAVDYPRYGPLRSELATVIDEIGRLVQDPDQLAVDFCEIVYVNHLRVEAIGEPLSVRLDHALRTCAPLDDADFLANPDEASWSGRWNIGRAGGANGRLHAAAEPMLLPGESQPIYVLTMTSRLPSSPVPLVEALELLDEGHEWIVRGFADLTTETMQTQWGRVQ